MVALLFIVILLGISLIITLNYIKELNDRLTKEIQHSVALERVIDNYIK